MYGKRKGGETGIYRHRGEQLATDELKFLVAWSLRLSGHITLFPRTERVNSEWGNNSSKNVWPFKSFFSDNAQCTLG